MLMLQWMPSFLMLMLQLNAFLVLLSTPPVIMLLLLMMMMLLPLGRAFVFAHAPWSPRRAPYVIDLRLCCPPSPTLPPPPSPHGFDSPA